MGKKVGRRIYRMDLRHSMEVHRKMIGLLRKASPGYIWVNLFNTLSNTFFYLVQLLFYKYVVDLIAYSEGSLEEAALCFLVYYVLCFVSYTLNLWVKNHYNELQKVKIRLFYKKLICTESSKKDIQKYSSGEEVNLLENAVYNDGSCLHAFADRMLDFMGSVILLAFFADIFGSLHPVFIAAIILSAAKNLICRNKTNKLNFQIYQNNLSFEKNNRAIYNIFYMKQFVRELRIYPLGELFIEKYNQLKYAQWHKNKRDNHRQLWISLASEGIDLLVYAGNILALAYFLLHGMVTVGGFSLVLANFSNAVNHLQGIILFFPAIRDDARYARDILSVVEEESYVYPKVEYDEERKCAVFQDVSFSYNGSKEVLKDIDIELPLNRKVAIVGENGAGKSTFIKLLLGIYSPTRGKVEYLYDREMDRSTELFGTILQEYQLFALSLKENLLAGRRQETDGDAACGKGCGDEIEEALRFSGLWEKVDGLSEKADTVLTGEFSENGIYLSGGERQKLAIARAYMGGHPVLILDEPSSNLDPVAENMLIDKINRLADEKAVIIITHNLAYTKNVDLVVVFDQGKIVEYGSPQKLMEHGGYYSRMTMEQHS